jgi:hypothetical protein
MKSKQLSVLLLVILACPFMTVLAAQPGGKPFQELPAPSYDSGWVPVEAAADLFPIPHPLGSDIFSALIAAESRSPGFTEFSPTFWSSNENEVKVDRGLFSPREVRVRIWVHR